MKFVRFFLGLMAEVLGYHWYPGCGHVSKPPTERASRRLRGEGWSGQICPECFEGSGAVCHWCRGAIQPGEVVTSGLILATTPESTKTAQLLGKGDLAVAQLGSKVLVLVSRGNARVGCSDPNCLSEHGEREPLGTWEGRGKITPIS